MVSVKYISRLAAAPGLHFGKISFKNLLNYSPNLMVWGATSFAGILVFVEGWPLFQQTLFQKIPVFGSHWIKEIPPEDKSN
ncbi:Cytochrome b-c1 complex subunit 10 [Nakaseomyces glabratus]|uniref:Cytochrome b-c1 complex subunit 10 n=1 Tax=Candida glabrata TaxID=5478 RepID=A0A0W0CAJ8_CANGB|nr:Ubiquinol-cytochrome-c reductase complex subunit (QCR10) [Nakaseomyces glabratus]KAH7596051.1 Ubiquinol-cytochrome-c reductase complex subunit (QCR10) [Nakaseomyces glabratus]KAH7596908.1 Ubiquinol-cytochrome-c reductase complex subunit (QCR10) [Nakaseomyces glabratus]KAH7602679.1 Ubiquinol-cytochrome-c reductase complex subunit (QCR10) [Nakaseomyces glabratus]KAH7611618.1 Ubiquinol-cytochrome-c reductase complex subunit (QCR10) [Nakaseomyces glabratus]